MSDRVLGRVYVYDESTSPATLVAIADGLSSVLIPVAPLGPGPRNYLFRVASRNGGDGKPVASRIFGARQVLANAYRR